MLSLCTYVLCGSAKTSSNSCFGGSPMAWNTIFLRKDIRGKDSVQNQGWSNTCRILLKTERQNKSKRRIYTIPVHRVIFKMNQIVVWNQEIPTSCWGCLSENCSLQCGDTGSGFASTTYSESQWYIRIYYRCDDRQDLCHKNPYEFSRFDPFSPHIYYIQYNFSTLDCMKDYLLWINISMLGIFLRF